MRHLGVLIACLMPVLAAGQGPPFNFLHFGTDEGLSSSTFTNDGAFSQDRQGYLWIGTANGLNRYDGTTFEHYLENPADSNTIRGAVITALYTDHQGIIWVGTYRNGLNRIDPKYGSIRHFTASGLDSVPQMHITAIFEDEHQRLWIAQAGKGLFLYDRESDEFQLVLLEHDQNKLHANNHFQHIISGHAFDPVDSSVVWLATVAGLCMLNTTTLESRFFLGEGLGCRRMYSDGTGNLWYSTWGRGLVRFDLQTRELSTYFYYHPDLNPDSTLWVTDITAMKDGVLILASEQLGLIMFDPVDTSFQIVNQVPHQDNSPQQPARFFRDADDNLWISTADEGIFCLQNQRQLYRQALVQGNVTKIVQDSGTRAVFATVDSSPRIYKLTTSTLDVQQIEVDTTRRPVGFPSAAVDRHGGVWFLEWHDLYRFDVLQNRAVPVEWPVWRRARERYGYYWDCLVDQGNRLWITAQDNGLGELDLNARQFTLHAYRDNDPRSYLRNYSVSYITKDSRNHIWAGSRDGFSYYTPESGDFENYPTPTLASDGGEAFARICAIAEDNQGFIWVAEYLNRVGRLDPRRPASTPVGIIEACSALPQALIRDIVCDPKGTIWLASDAGLTRVDAPYDSAVHFGEPYGIGGVNDLLILTDGTLLAALHGRILFIDPDLLVPVIISPQPVLTAFHVFDKPYQNIAHPGYLAEVHLDYRQNFFSFEYSAIDFVDQGARDFSYMLEGLDEEWINAGTRQYASYTNIGGGSYVFKVRVKDALGRWSDRVATLPIVVTPPIHGRWWFWPLVAGVCVCIVIVIYRWRIAQIRKEAALKTEFNKQLAEVEMKALRAQMNPHFLFNSLNAIKYYVLKKDRHMAADYLNDFSRLIRLVLQNSADKLIPLSREIEALKLYMQIESLRFDKQFQYEVNVEGELDTGSILVPPLIFQPYVENAIWHGLMHKTDGHGVLRIHLAQSNGQINCTIQDNGIGREKAALVKSKSAEKRKSMGMQITRHRMNMSSVLNDMAFSVAIRDLYAEDGRAAGTRVEISFHQKKLQHSQS